MASIKVLKKLHQTNNERRSLVKELIALRPISPVVTRKTHPLQTLYEDTCAPPLPIDQFAPYLSRKLTLKRNAQIEKMKSKKKSNQPSFFVTNSIETQSEVPLNIEKKEGEDDTKKEELSTERNNERYAQIHTLQSHLKMEQTFDKIAASAASTALHRLIESTLQVYFVAEKVLFYHDISSVKVLYCPSTTAYCPHGTGLVGYAQFSRKTLNLSHASEHVAYSLVQEGNQCPPDSHVLIFPLFDASTHVRGVVEVIRDSNSPLFTDDDIKFVEYFQTKCRMYARWLFQPVLDDSFASDLMQTSRLRQFMESIREKLTRLFSCRGAEIWHFNKQTEVIKQYTPKNDEPVTISSNEAGISGFSLRQQVPVSCIFARVHSAYCAKTDGNGDYSVLVIPVRDPDSPLIYALVLRGKRIPQFFTDNDEKILARIAPYVIASLNSAEIIEKNHRALKDSMHQQKRLRSLLDVAETLSGQLRMDILIPNIMQRACELVKADRCSLFMVNETRDKLVTSFQGGLANSIEIPLNKGIVGFTATTGEILNIEDAYEDSRFNRATDLATGYRTLTLLCVPIFDDKQDIRGVTEMINKLDGVFTKEDEKLIQIFNVFCGISLENARLYRASIDLSLQLRSFFEISTSLAQPQTIKKMMEDILRNTRKVFGAVRALLFMIENNGISFTPYVQDEDIEAKLKKVQQKKQEEAEDSLGVKRAIISKLMHGKKNDHDAEQQREEEARNRLIEHAITNKESVLENDPQNPERSLIIVPILSSDRAVLGAVMMQWKKTLQKFSFDDQKLLESYSVFLSLSLERSKLKSIAQLGTMEVEMQTWIAPEERMISTLPEKLKMTDDERNLGLLTINFDSTVYQSGGLFNVVFNLFDIFKLNDTFKIKAQTLFTFLYEIKKAYNPVQYHNWNHAVDTTQFLAYEMFFGNLQSIFTPFEIFIMFVACLCHDVNHDGFSTAYNAKAEIPLGILFNNQSVLETHHCSVAISILTKDESNVFSSFDDDEMNRMWPIFISLILSTDMAKHFDILEECKKLMSSGKRWQNSESGRLTMMKILIKSADLSTATRLFSNADKHAALVCEEFFRQGEIEKCEGIVYQVGFNDRDHLDKQKSQIPFFKGVAFPLFETLGKAIPTLSTLVQHMQLNISKWEDKERAKLEEIKRRRHEEEEEEKERERFAKKIDDIDIDGKDVDLPDEKPKDENSK
ncbi:3'5'-cyclic nucleotide phosphodiesterase family protein [Tritrichomonas foetus]|uniref:3'5'-cyclic nucleotide phosphodiesterase family protein n=1 Tax=Tritrichomonas foetus TaxID=1144522 RepID=A0A1J4KJK5_9EUKA|nr:3'5'-cyclic nucleotide phosphodiesterase family protein [Tritrichomonas foetus]|eukprot:OHT11136.1 3'5'-cyclic nucleotide phosphodiesterase family protein [Tritrichomonas foetus]